MTAELATLPTARLVRPLVLRWPSCLARPSRFADSARATHAPRARATGRTPLTHCSSSSLCTCSRRGGSTSRWRSWTSRRRSSRAAACRKRPLGAGATAWPLAGGDARCRSGLLYAPRASEGTPAAATPSVAAYLYGAAVSACQRRSFPAVSHPGPGSGSSTWCHASRQGAATRSAPPWELAPPPPRCSPPLPRRRSCARSGCVSVVSGRYTV